MTCFYLVPVDGVAPSSRVYESLVLTLELHRQFIRLTKDSIKTFSIRQSRSTVPIFEARNIAFVEITEGDFEKGEPFEAAFYAMF